MTKLSAPQPFLPSEQKWRDQIELYRESNVDEQLFSLKKRPGEYGITRAWANAIRSNDATTRDAALSLFKAYLSYTGVDSAYQMSAHTQMKMMLFTGHLTEGGNAKAMLYESLFDLPLPQFIDFAAALRKDFTQMPPMLQALVLKKLMAYWKKNEKTTMKDNQTQLRRLVKDLVVMFYSGKAEQLAPELAQQEKIRMGFLKFTPVQDAYQKALEDIERRYRLKLRQLKKSRFQKVAEAEEVKMRQIEMIYEDVESDLTTGLSELQAQMEEFLATQPA